MTRGPTAASRSAPAPARRSAWPARGPPPRHPSTRRRSSAPRAGRAERPRGGQRQQQREHDRDDVAGGADPQRQRERHGEQHAGDRRRDEAVDRDLRGLHEAVRAIEAAVARRSPARSRSWRCRTASHRARRRGWRSAGSRCRGLRSRSGSASTSAVPPRSVFAIAMIQRRSKRSTSMPAGQAEDQPRQEGERADRGDRERIAGQGRRDQRHGGAADAVGEVAEGGRGPELAEVAPQAGACGRATSVCARVVAALIAAGCPGARRGRASRAGVVRGRRRRCAGRHGARCAPRSATVSAAAVVSRTRSQPGGAGGADGVARRAVDGEGAHDASPSIGEGEHVGPDGHGPHAFSLLVAVLIGGGIDEGLDVFGELLGLLGRSCARSRWRGGCPPATPPARR